MYSLGGGVECWSVRCEPEPLEIFLTHRQALVGFAAGILKSDLWAEDVVQDAYVRLSNRYVQSERFHNGDRPEIKDVVRYIFRIVRNLSLDRLRQLRSERNSAKTLEFVDVSSALLPNPEEDVLLAQMQEPLREALAELSERSRLALEMRYLQDCSLREIAVTLGISVARTDQIVRAALLQCARRLADAVTL
jgi:RNA polymerase sigma-70 factor (ECF subfamily)